MPSEKTFEVAKSTPEADFYYEFDYYYYARRTSGA